MPLWGIDDFELKVPEKQQVHEGLPDPLLSTVTQGLRFPTRKVPSLHQEENILITRDWKAVPKGTCTNKRPETTLILH